MRALALVLALGALLAGCGGDDVTSPPVTAATGEEPGAGEPVRGEDERAGVVLTHFVDAAGAGDVETMWSLLTPETQERLGPTLEDFRNGVATALQEGVGSFAGTPYEVVLSQRIDAEWGMAAIAGPRRVEGTEELGAYASALRDVDRDGTWLLEIGAVELAPPLDDDVEAWLADHPGALLWVDGALVAEGEAPQAEPGAVLVAFVREDDRAAAVAWVAR